MLSLRRATLVLRSIKERCFLPKKAALSTLKNSIGQENPIDHPHLVAAHEITPGISREEYVTRRNQLMSSEKEHTVFIIPGAASKIMSHDIPYPFRQNSDFSYFCGFHEPNAVLVLIKLPKHRISDDVSTLACLASHQTFSKNHIMLLFVERKDKAKEIWDGVMSGTENAVQFFNADKAYPNTALKTVLAQILTQVTASEPRPAQPDLLPHFDFKFGETAFHRLVNTTTTAALSNASFDKPTVYTTSKSQDASTQNQAVIKDVLGQFSQHISLSTEGKRKAHLKRAIKTLAELQIMQRSADISSAAFIKAMASTRPGITEHHIEAILEFHCRVEGCQRLAYPPVVASGANATTLHYVANNRKLNSGDLLLVDAGGELHNYASDITRTWPISGRFSEPQRLVYGAVLRVQESLIARAVAGETLQGLYAQSLELMREELHQISLAVPQHLADPGLVFRYYMHNVGHHLGIDTHDVSTLASSTPLVENMVITIEPGMYVPEDDPIADPRFHGIGIRIEDDVVIQKQGPPIVLTRNAPKTIKEIEALVGKDC